MWKSKIADKSNSFSDLTGSIVSFGVVFMIIFPSVEAALRSFFHRPTIWSQELTVFIFGAYFVLGGAYALKEKAHVAMDIFYLRYTRRVRKVVDTVIFVFIAMICITLIYLGFGWAWESTLVLERSETFWAPYVWPVKWAIPIGSFLLLLQAFAELIKSCLDDSIKREDV